MEIPPEEELRLLQSQQRASRAQQPAFQQRAAIVGATVVVGLVIYLTVTVQDPQARSIFEFVLLLFCIPLAVALLLILLRGAFERLMKSLFAKLGLFSPERLLEYATEHQRAGTTPATGDSAAHGNDPSSQANLARRVVVNLAQGANGEDLPPEIANDPEVRRLMNQARNVLAKGSAFPAAMNLVGWVFALVLVLGLALGIVAVFALLRAPSG